MSYRKRAISLALMGAFSLAVPAYGLAQEEESPPSASEPEPAAPEPSEEVISGTASNKRQWGVGARLRYVFVPQGLLDLFLAHSTTMTSVGIGAEVVGRKGDTDIVFGIEYDGASPDDGLYQDKGDDPGLCPTDPSKCPDYTEFDGLGVIGLDASFIWHARLADRIHLRYGGGLGLGIVTGSIYQTKMRCPSTTTNDTLDDPNACGNPGNPGDQVEPRKESDDVPPVVPIINVLLGARFLVTDNLSLNLEAGFRDVFYVGLGSDWVF
jgi:hypothetical protein